MLLNDTAAVIGTPVVLQVARRERLDPKLMLLALAFGVVQGAERYKPKTILTFMDFFKVGVVTTSINAVVYWVFLILVI